MVDAIDSKSVIRKGVRVQVPSPVKIRTGQKACPDFYWFMPDFVGIDVERPHSCGPSVARISGMRP